MNAKQKTAVYRTLWLIITTAVIILIAIATPLRYRMLQSDIYNYAAGLEALGLTLNFFAAYFVSWELVVVIGSLLVAGLIVWKRADDWFAMLVALGLTLFGLLPPLIDGLRFANPQWAVPISGLRIMIMGLLMAILCLFPNGRFQPKWMRWLLILWSIFSMGVLLTQPLMLADTAVLPNTRSWQDALWLLIGVAWFSSAIAGQIVRYRHHATTLEKQQMKWVLLGFSVLVFFSVISAVLLIQNPAINNSAVNGVRFTLIMGAFYLLLALALPTAITLSILRYRLWDVDILLNRTLVYGGLTGLITAVYILLVGGIGTLASNQNGQVGALLLTLIVSGIVIRPLHRWLARKVNQFLPIQIPGPQAQVVSKPQSVKWLRIGWVANFLLLLILFGAGLIAQAKTNYFQNPNEVSQFADVAITRILIDNVLVANPNIGLFILLASYAQAIASAGVGLFIFAKKANDVMGIIASWMFVSVGIGFTPTIVGLPLLAPAWHIPVTLFQIGLFGSTILFLAIFPNGRFYPTWSKYILLGWLLFMLLWFPFPQLNLHRSATIWPAFSFALMMLLGIVAQIFRYQYHLNTEQKQQAKWVIFGFLFANSGLISIGLLTEFNLTLSTPIQLFGFIFLALGPLAIPLTVTVALLRYRLWQIDLIINRTLVYGGITVVILLTYAITVGGLSLLWQSQNNLLLSLLATGLIAVLFQPVRERLQRAANRMMFGDRDDPYAVLSKLGIQLQTNNTPETMLHSVVATIATTLKLPYVAIELVNEQERLHAASTGNPLSKISELPLRYQNETVGYLIVSPRSPSEPFSEREQQLLTDIAGQTGTAAYSVRLTTALQKSREELVLTREEERRRIRRDLHDQLGPTLASQTFALDAAIDLLESDPQAAAQLLKSLKTQNQATVADIRRLVYALRPPTLDELGIMGALQAHIAQLNGRSNLAIILTANPDPLPSLSAAVEVAAYRIALEAINNVVRHAQASRCDVRFELVTTSSSLLQIIMTDDGVGLPATYQNGIGLNSMRERAEELGGHFTVTPLVQGTQITAVLPNITLIGGAS